MSILLPICRPDYVFFFPFHSNSIDFFIPSSRSDPVCLTGRKKPITNSLRSLFIALFVLLFVVDVVVVVVVAVVVVAVVDDDDDVDVDAVVLVVFVHMNISFTICR